MKIFDTHAWFEFFTGSVKGHAVKKIIDSGEEIGTSVLTLTELIRKLKRENHEFDRQIAVICVKSRLIQMTKEIAVRAGSIQELHFSDALIMATALQENAVLVTGDPDFKGLKGVELLK